MNLSRRTLLKSAAAASSLMAGLPAAQAQTLDVARVYGGFAAGGSVDTLSRRLAEKLAPDYAKAVLVEPKPGAGGQLAISTTKSSAPDGRTMLVTPMSMLAIYPHTFRKLPYDPFTDLTPVSVIANFEFGFGVGPAVPAEVKTVPQFMAWAKANPQKASFGTPGAGSSTHFIGILLGREGGVELTHVGYRGSQPAVLDMMGGQLPAISAPLGEFLPHLAGGKVRLLGTSGAKRNAFTANIPTYAEQGFKNMVFEEQFCLYLPPGASPAVVERLRRASEKAMTAPEVAAALATFAIVPATSTPAGLAALQKAEHDRWGPVVRSIGFTADT
ncbi:MAG: Twin-arginine translocation pathway signal [Ramlibacter sp.]|jgi:tripartite-type tricarboxylate transporter receptor subunit TctC|nr:Twin-arginine translocation pathway signal [Ramlibacter sp.]